MINEQRTKSLEPRYPWMEGFDVMFDHIYHSSGTGTLPSEYAHKTYLLGKVGINFSPEYSTFLSKQSLNHILNERNYDSILDAIRFAEGARSSLDVMYGVEL